MDLDYVNVCEHEHEKNFQRHEKPHKQRLKRKFQCIFQTRNKTRLCDSKTKTQDLREKT